MGIKNKNIVDFYPLSPTQQGILFHTIAAPASDVYFEQFSWTITGNFNIEAFHQAWEYVIQRHAILRTCFVWEGLKEPVQVVHQQVTLPWVLHDWRHLASVEQQEQLAAFLTSDRAVGFELTRPPLMRWTIHHLSEHIYQLTWSHHHILLDGWSIAIIYKEVFDCYKAFIQCQNLSLSSVRPYRDYIVWLQQQNLSQAEAFWQEKLQGFSAPTQIFLDKNYRQLTSESNGNHQQEIKLSLEKTAALQLLAKQHELTFNTIVQGAWALLLSRYSSQEDVVFGATTSGRPPTLAKADSMVGLFINTLPVRIQVSPKELLLPWLKQIQTQQIETSQYEFSPLWKVQKWSEIPQGLRLFETIIVFENYPVDASLKQLNLNLKIKTFSIFEKTNYPLTLVVNQGEELCLQIIYDSERFNAATISRMVGHFQTLLESIIANPHQRLTDLVILTEAERHQLLFEWNHTQVDYPQDKCIHQLFEAQVEQTPDAIAVVFEQEQLTYRQLNTKANQLAQYLQQLGVKPDVPVGICLERSLEMVIAILAILKAGGAYVPLDPAYPQERLAFIIQDTQISFLLTQQEILPVLPKHPIEIVCLNRDWEVIAKQSQDNPVSNCTVENLAYVIYTSGSTGQPKGVLIEHRNVTRLFDAVKSRFNFNSEDVWTLFHSIAFDFSVWELWGALLYGGRLVIVPYWLTRSPEAFYNLLWEQQVTVLNQTPSAFRQLIAFEESLETTQELALRLVIFGGEALEIHRLKPWFEHHGDQFPQLVNMYGITETSVHVTYRPLTIGDLNQGLGSVIGRPIPDLQVYLLDQHQQPVPIGVPGEMYIGGAGLARGYLHRPELTQEKFIPHPFSNQANARLYRSGDLGRYLANGDIEYLGRIDQQVKIRGFRIELGEIETMLAQHPAVRETVVLARTDDTGNQQLVAYVVPSHQQTPTISQLRNFLQQQLPEFMLPAFFIILAALPLTANGKVDYQSLPNPDNNRPELDEAFVAPRNAQEKILADIWASILGLEQVGIYDNFFELGGHSLLLTQLLNRLHKAFKIDIAFSHLFENQTIATLSQLIIDKIGSQEAEVKPKLNRELLLKTFPTEQVGLVEDYLKQKIADLLNIDMTLVLLNGNLRELDLELIAVDLVGELQQDLLFSVSRENLLKMSAIAQLAQFIVTEITSNSDSEQQLIAKFTQLSDAERKLLLSNMLSADEVEL